MGTGGGDVRNHEFEGEKVEELVMPLLEQFVVQHK